MAQNVMKYTGTKGMQSLIRLEPDGGVSISIYAGFWPESIFDFNISENDKKDLIEYLQNDYNKIRV